MRKLGPVSAYGESKLMAETELRWAERVYRLCSARVCWRLTIDLSAAGAVERDADGAHGCALGGAGAID
jgi:UDP-glucose 4-epimerase